MLEAAPTFSRIGFGKILEDDVPRSAAESSPMVSDESLKEDFSVESFGSSESVIPKAAAIEIFSASPTGAWGGKIAAVAESSAVPADATKSPVAPSGYEFDGLTGTGTEQTLLNSSSCLLASFFHTARQQTTAGKESGP